MNRRHVYDDQGADTGATFGLETRGTAITLRYDSRGTTAGTRAYRAGLLTLLRRLRALRVPIADIVVDSTTVQGLPRPDRRLRMPAFPYPIDPPEDPGKLRAAMHTAAARVGRPPGAKGGGNGTKKLRVYLKITQRWQAPAGQLEDRLAGSPRKAVAA